MINISVIIPSYNVVRYIRQCIDSVLSQNFGWVEVICVDAWSTDGTLEIINEYAANDNRVRLFCSDYKSYGKQVNIGIEAARGEYISIIESDDYVDDDMLRHLYWHAINRGVQIVKGQYYQTFELDFDHIVEKEIQYMPRGVRSGIAFIPDYIPIIHKTDDYIWNGLYQKSFLDKYTIRFNETPGAAYQDISFQQKILNHAESMVYLRNTFYHYRVTRQGASSLNPNCLRYVYQEYKHLLEEYEIKPSRIPYVYLRMLTAFPREYGKAMMVEPAHRDSEIDAEFAWFRNRIIDGLDTILVSRDIYTDEMRRRSDKFLFHYDEYKKETEKDYQILSEWYKRFNERRSSSRIVLVGCGRRGLPMVDFFLRNRINLIAVTDNDESKWGTEFGPYTIMKPKVAVEQYSDAVYCITNKYNVDEITAQLNSLGISNDSIESFTGEFESIPSIAQRHPEILG